MSGTRCCSLGIAGVLLVTTLRAHAEADPQTLAPPKLDLASLDRSYRRAQVRRNVGIGLAVPGIALNVLGAVLLSYGATDPSLLSQTIAVPIGAIVSLVGLAIAIPGVVLWILDQDSMDVLTWRRRQLRVGFRPTVTAGPNRAFGVAVTF